MLGSGNNLSRGGLALSNNLSQGGSALSLLDVPPLPQVLPLEPIGLGNKKHTRFGEIRRVLGVPGRTSSEDHLFGVGQHRSPPPVVTEELKHFKESVQGTSREAGDRAKKLGDSIFILDKYAEALSSKKRRRNDMSPSDRLGRVNLEKLRDQIPRNPEDAMAQCIDERKKFFGLNKRARTSMAADVQADGRVAAFSRQHLAAERDDDSFPGVSGDSVRIEENILRLPGGGEGWETKMKRKRSVSTLGHKVMNVEQSTMQPKLTTDSKLRSCDNQAFRSKSSLGGCGINRLDVTSDPDSPEASTLFRNELEPLPLRRDRSALIEQRVMAKGNRKNSQDDNPVNNSSAMLKGKVSRAPRTGSAMVLDSSSKFHPSAVAFQGSSSRGMAQWAGQKPHKNSRTRRTNLVSPVVKHDENKIPSGVAKSDCSPRTSQGTTGACANFDSSSSKVKRKPKNVSSPYGFSESEESGAKDKKARENGIDGGEMTPAHKTKTLLLQVRKNKAETNQNKDNTWVQGKTESVSSLTMGMYPIMNKMENLTTGKNARAPSDKHKNKSGRPPSKKLKDRKAVLRLGSNANIGASDFTGESVDDHEDLLAAANSARKASYLACSGSFWKKMEYIFAPVNSDDIACMKQQVSLIEEFDESLSEVISVGCNILDVAQKDVSQKDVSPCLDVESRGYSVHKSSETDPSFKRSDMRKLNETTPLYKRVLSALIEEDEGQEVLQHCEGKDMSLHYASDDSHCSSSTHMDTEPKERDRIESEVESNADFQIPKNCLSDRLSCDKSVVSNSFRNPSMSMSVHSTEPWVGDDDLSLSEAGIGSEICSDDVGRIQLKELNIPSFPSSDSQYQRMSLDERVLLELQKIGVYPEALPDLAEEDVSSDIMELKEEIYQQIQSKKKTLEKVDKTIQKGIEADRRKTEHLALDQLVEMAHRRRMACCGSKGSKIRKVSRKAALAFIKRTVSRCRKFEQTGRTCFGDPPLQDILFSSYGNEAKSADNGGSGTASNTCNEVSNHQTEARGSGAVSSTKRREALMEDVDGSASSRITTSLDSGKKTEREKDLTKDSARNISSAGQTERKIQLSTNQKNNQNRTSTHPTGPSSRVKVAMEDPPAPPIDFGNLQLPDLDSMDEPQDLGNWLDFDNDDGLQDIDTAGLEIPMDDLSELNMLM